MPQISEADVLAKDGALGLGSQGTITVKPSRTILSSEIDTKIRKMWSDRWQNGKDARQTRLFFPDIDLKKSRELRKLTRENLSKAIRAITGHDFRRRHESLVSGVNLGNCRFCDQQEESSFHVVNQCPRLAWKRMEIFKTQLGATSNPGWQVRQLVAFLSYPSISEMETPSGEE